MRDSNRISGVVGMMVGGFVSMALPLAAEAGNARRAVAKVAEGRLEVTFDRWSDSTRRQASAGIRMDRAGMAYRFHVAAFDSTGQKVAAPAAWDVTILGGSAAVRPLVSLSGNTFELDLPRPLGIRIEQADSIEIVATFADASGISLRVTVDYDPADGAASRLAVMPVALSATVVAGTTVRHWDLTLSQNGRLLAIAGLPVLGLTSVSLVDVETGSTLWQSTVSSTFGAPSSVARMGVAMQGGRQYRIVASVAADQPMREQAVVAMVLPAR